jgi:hypothetical protein
MVEGESVFPAEVTLSMDEIRAIADYAVRCRSNVERGGYRHIHNLKDKKFNNSQWNHEKGGAGECALAKFLGIPWDKQGRSFRGADLVYHKTLIQVRTNRFPSHMKVRIDDPAHYCAFYVYGEVPFMTLAGWCWVYEAKVDDFLTTRYGIEAYWVPFGLLHKTAVPKEFQKPLLPNAEKIPSVPF